MDFEYNDRKVSVRADNPEIKSATSKWKPAITIDGISQIPGTMPDKNEAGFDTEQEALDYAKTNAKWLIDQNAFLKASPSQT